MKLHMCLLALLGALQSFGDVTVGWRESKEISVSSGDETTVDGVVTIGDRGVLYKTGGGSLTLPASRIDRHAAYEIEALGGTLKLTPGAAPAPQGVPDIVSRSALWLKADANVVSEEGGTAVSRWCDARESDLSARTYPSAVASTKFTTDKPTVATRWNNPSVYFGGLGSGQGMTFKTATDADLNMTYVTTVFAVFGAFDAWSSPLGRVGENNYNSGITMSDQGLSDPDSYLYQYQHNVRGDQNGGPWTARNMIDGEFADLIWRKPPTGFHLLTSVQGVVPLCLNSLYLRRTQDKSYSGGEYLSEVIVFTNALTAAQIVSVERYLMGRWNLRYDPTEGEGGHVGLDRDVGRIGSAAGATVEIAVGDGEESAPVALSGEGHVVKTGAGKLVLGPSGEKPFAGAFELSGGSIALRGGQAPDLAVRGGDRLTAAFTPSGSGTTRAQQLAGGTEISVTRNSENAGVVRKTGDAEARLSAIDPSVSKIAVEAGTLVFSAPRTTSNYVPVSEGTVAVEVPNADFEAYGKDHPDYTLFKFTAGTPSYGWYGNNDWVRYVTFPTLLSYNLINGFAEGLSALQLKGGSKAWTFVSFPKPGVYELSLMASMRFNDNKTKHHYAVCLDGESVGIDAAKIAGHLIASKGSAWTRYTFKLTVAAAGTHLLGFRPYPAAASYYADEDYYIDDLKVNFVASPRMTPAVPVPNGDFELYTDGSAFYDGLNVNASADGWTFDTSGATSTGSENPAVALANASKYAKSSSKPTHMFASDGTTYGSTHLAFLGAGGKASTTFSMPAGTYQLVGRQANWNSEYKVNGGGASIYPSAESVVRAKVSIAGAGEINLGEVESDGHAFRDVVWATALTLDAPSEVTLTLENTSNSATLVDDLAFDVPVAIDPGELVSDGSGEQYKTSLTTWTPEWDAYYPSEPIVGNYKRRSASVLGGAQYWGYAVYSGQRVLQIGQNAGLRQTVSIPTPGLYRLRFAGKSRTDNPATAGRNPICAMLLDSAGQTNVITRVEPYGLNYAEYSAYFRVECAGEYSLVIRGLTMTDGDHTSQIDGVSIRKVLGEVSETPTMPNAEKTTIEVTAGARLQLDYPGCLRVDRLKLGGRSVHGIVDAQHYPEFISGLGSIEVPRHGLIMVVE